MLAMLLLDVIQELIKFTLFAVNASYILVAARRVERNIKTAAAVNMLEYSN